MGTRNPKATFRKGQHTMAESMPVVFASDQAAIPISGTVTANQGTAHASEKWKVLAYGLGHDGAANALRQADAKTAQDKGLNVQGGVCLDSSPALGNFQVFPIRLTTRGETEVAVFDSAGNAINPATATKQSDNTQTTQVVDSAGNALQPVKDAENFNANDRGVLMYGVDDGTPAKYRKIRIDSTGDQYHHLKNASDTIINPATEDTAALIKAKTDNLDILLSALRDAITGTSPNNKTLNDLLTRLNLLLADATFTGRIGEVQASPTANTLLARLKDLLTGIVLSTGSNAIGKLAANSGVDIGDVDVTSIAAGTNLIGDVDVAPRTTGGWSIGNFTSGDTYTALTNSAQVIKGSAGKFGGYYIYNPNAAAIYVMVYDIAAASVTVGTSTAKLVFCIPATAAANLELLAGIPFATAMSIAAATTGGGNTAPTTALEAMVFYK